MQKPCPCLNAKPSKKHRRNSIVAPTKHDESIVLTDAFCVDAQGERLVLFFSELLGAITHCISDIDPVVRERAGEANKDLLELVQVNENDCAIPGGVYQSLAVCGEGKGGG